MELYLGIEAIDVFLIVCLYGLATSMVHFKKHKDILLANVFTNLIGFFYLYLNHAETGASLCIIAALASFIQFIFPEETNKKWAFLRNGIAIFFAIMAVVLLYGGASDILVCSSIVYMRWAETRNSSQKIRYSTAYAGFTWAVYSFEHGLLLMLLAESVLCLSAVFAITRNSGFMKHDQFFNRTFMK